MLPVRTRVYILLPHSASANHVATVGVIPMWDRLFNAAALWDYFHFHNYEHYTFIVIYIVYNHLHFRNNEHYTLIIIDCHLHLRLHMYALTNARTLVRAKAWVAQQPMICYTLVVHWGAARILNSLVFKSASLTLTRNKTRYMYSPSLSLSQQCIFHTLADSIGPFIAMWLTGCNQCRSNLTQLDKS